MFDLERHIQDWKAGFTSMPALRRTDAEELEQHVRDGLPSLIASGLSAEEAFLIATRRVGAPAAIEREFAKVNGTHLWAQRVFWVVAGALGYVVCRLLIAAAASVTQALIGLAGWSAADAGYAGVAVTCLGWVAVGAALLRRGRSTESLTIRPSAAVAAAVMLALVLAVTVNFAAEAVLWRLMLSPEAARAMGPTILAARAAALLVPLVLFTTMLFRLRERTGAAE